MPEHPRLSDIQHYKQFLLSQDEKELAALRTRFSRLLQGLSQHGCLTPSKRPHLAMPERRDREERYIVNLTGSCRDTRRPNKPNGAKKRQPVRLLDISPSGCRLISDIPYRPLQVLSLEIPIPGEKATRLPLEVVRARKRKAQNRTGWEIGCRALDIEIAERVRKESKRLELVLSEFDNRNESRILILTHDPACRQVAEQLSLKGHPVSTVKSAGKILSTLKDSNPDASPIRVVICSASTAARKPTPAWLMSLHREYPRVGIVAITAKNQDAQRARAEAQIDQVVLADRAHTDLPPALRQTLLNRLVSDSNALPVLGLKILVAGESEKRGRRMQALLAGKDYLVDTANAFADATRELEHQFFNAIILNEKLLSGNPEEEIERIRTACPKVVILIETTSPKVKKAYLANGADLALKPSASRAEILKSLAQARQIFQQNTLLT